MQGEGDQWYARNNQQGDATHNFFAYQQILNFVLTSLDAPSILEIGCSSGSKLNFLAQGSSGHFYGIDPSGTAIEDGKIKYPNLNLFIGTADRLPFDNASFDLIIFGFCLYLCDRDDLFRIAAEADRCLKQSGFIAIIDFYSDIPYSNTYKHRDGLLSYKMNYANMFLWNPRYSLVSQIPYSHSSLTFHKSVHERIAIQILYKDSLESIIPCNIYS